MHKNLFFGTLFVIFLISSVGVVDTIPDKKTEKGIRDKQAFGIDSNIVHAQESIIERGKNYNIEILSNNSDGTQTKKFTTNPERISADEKYWHGYYFSNDNGNLRFESASMSFEFYSDTNNFKIWSGGMINNRSPDIPSFSTTLKTAINGTDTWTSYPLIPSSYSFEEIPNGIKISLQQNHNDVILKSIFDTTYHKGLKWTYEITNLTKENSKFGITTVCNDCGEIFIDGEGYLDGVWGKEDLINNDGTLKEIKIKDFIFDPQDYTHDYLWAFKNINGNIIFDFTYSKGVLEIGETLVIDPDFSSGVSSEGQIYSASQSSSSCSASYGSFSTSPGTQLKRNSINGVCGWTYFIFDLSTLSTEEIDEARFIYHSSSYGDNNSDVESKTCRWVYSDDDTAGSSMFTDFQTESFVIGDDEGCESEGTDGIIYTIPSSHYSTMEGEFGSTYVIGMNHHTQTRIGDDIWYNFAAGDQSLEIDFITTSPPDAITNLSLDSITQTTATISFTAPDLNGESLINYLFNQTSPHGNPLTFSKNDTLTTTTITGLTLGTDYSFRASALTAGGYNATGNILNVTTTTLIVPDTPSLTGLAESHTNAIFTSIAGVSFGSFSVKDYSLQCEINNSGGWLDTINNSTLPIPRSYNYTGLVESDSITCQ